MPRNEPRHQITDLPTLPSPDWQCLQWCTHHYKSFIEKCFWTGVHTYLRFAGSLLLHCLPSWQTVIAIGTVILPCSERNGGGGPAPSPKIRPWVFEVVPLPYCRAIIYATYGADALTQPNLTPRHTVTISKNTPCLWKFCFISSVQWTICTVKPK